MDLVLHMMDYLVHVTKLFILLSTIGVPAYFILRILYNIFLHPLRHFPGPKLWAASRVPYARAYLAGNAPNTILRLHEKYGNIVRVAPDELLFHDPNAWKDIMGHRKTSTGENIKDPVFYKRHFQSPDILGADRENHARYRRLLAHGFSARSMLDQQPLIRSYVDLLIQRLRENCENGQRPLDMVSWYNWTTFDIIGDLAFGEPFDCLKTCSYHFWVQVIFDNIRGNSLFIISRRFPMFTKLIQFLIPKSLKDARKKLADITTEKVERRIQHGANRPDFMSAMLKATGDEALTKQELYVNSSFLVIAGSETTATVLSGATFFLGTHPDILNKLNKEIRSAFQDEDEITLLSVQKLPYMLAVFDETLRLYPPVPNGMPRIVAAGGDTICGEYVPENTKVAISQWAMNHSSKHFRDSENFCPERWLGSQEFVSDQRDAVQPFHIGARNCLGKNLAYSEMRLILARVLFDFEIKLADDSRTWISDQKCYNLWIKGPLHVYLTPRKRD